MQSTLESKGLDTGGGFAYYSPSPMDACPAPGAVPRDIVPADVLAADAGRGLRAAECATMLDGYLRRLARQEAQPHHRLRLAPPAGHPPGPRAGLGHGARHRHLGARHAPRTAAA